MSVIYLLIPLASAIAIAAVGAFIWATRQGQFDDLDTPAIRAIQDDDESQPEPAAPHAQYRPNTATMRDAENE